MFVSALQTIKSIEKNKQILHKKALLYEYFPWLCIKFVYEEMTTNNKTETLSVVTYITFFLNCLQ